ATSAVADLPTIAVQFNPGQELTYRTREDDLVTAATSDDFSTKSMDNGTSLAAAQQPASPASSYEDVPASPPPTVVASAPSSVVATPTAASTAPTPVSAPCGAPSQPVP